MAVSSSEEYWNTHSFRLSNSHSRGLPSDKRPGNIHLILKATYIEVKLWMLCSKRRDGYKKPIHLRTEPITEAQLFRAWPGVKKQNWRDREWNITAQSHQERLLRTVSIWSLDISKIWMETPQPMWAICFCVMTTLTVRKIFHLFEWISCISGSIHHLLFFPWSPTQKSLRDMFYSHISYIYTLARYPMRLLQAEQFQLSQPILKCSYHIWQSSLIAELSALCPYLSCTGKSSTGLSTTDVSYQCWAEEQHHLPQLALSVVLQLTF